MSPFVAIRGWLEAVNPNLPWLLLVAASWSGTYAARRWAPVQWAAVIKWGKPGGLTEHLLQALPGTIAAAALGALGAGGDPWSAAKGALAGSLAPLWHHLLKLAPVPYKGAMGERVSGPESRRRIVEDIE